MLLAGQMTEINMHISTFPVYYSLQHWFQLPNHSLIFQATPFADENSKINRSFGRTESCWEEDSEEIILHCLASFNMSHPNTRCVHVDLACMGVGPEIALIGDTIGKPNNCAIIGDTRQAMSEEKIIQLKLIRLVATALPYLAVGSALASFSSCATFWCPCQQA